MRFPRIAALALVFVGLAGPCAAQSIQINRDNKTIAIGASDEATATADIAAITVGYKAGVDDKKIESSSQGLLKTPDLTTKSHRSSEQRNSSSLNSRGRLRFLRRVPPR
jgi:hypothetical protein